jgi:hypothetical protein
MVSNTEESPLCRQSFLHGKAPPEKSGVLNFPRDGLSQGVLGPYQLSV